MHGKTPKSGSVPKKSTEIKRYANTDAPPNAVSRGFGEDHGTRTVGNVKGKGRMMRQGYKFATWS